MVFETSWDDGSIGDLEIARLLSKYKLQGTFYIPIDRELDWYKCREIGKKFEIGCHSFTHPSDMKLLDDDNLRLEVATAKEALESVFGREIKSYCYPRGRYDDRVVEALKEAGFEEGRTTVVLETGFEWTKDMFRKPTSVHAYDRAEYMGDSWTLVAVRLFDKALAENGYFHLWGHSWEINKNNDWENLEKFFKYVAGKLKK